MGSFIHVYTDGGGIREARVPDDFSGLGSQPFVVKFPGFRKSLLASLVANSTASRTSDIVTVTATAHGIPTGTTYVGFRFFYPGSAGLTAGWYDSIVSIPDANTITFNAPGANFGSQSVNGAAAYTTLTSVSAFSIAAGFLKPFSRITFVYFRSGDTTATTKNIRNIINGSQVGLSGATTAPNGTHRVTVALEGGFMMSAAAQDQTLSTSFPIGALDPLVDNTFGFSASLSAAGAFVAIHNASMEIIH
jgi:hypothetical protein